MATDNGARFIAEQLASLVGQEVMPFELVVCDDGSSDGTPEIVEAFAATAPFPVRVYRNERNLGYGDNFFKAARLCTGDWIAFCDQDDVWLPSRIGDARAAILSNPGIVLVLQNAFLCGEDLSHKGTLFPNILRPRRYSAFSQPGFWVWEGFMQTVDKAIFLEIDTVNRSPSYSHQGQSIVHDTWACLIANLRGGFVVLPGAAALYRRHQGSVSGSHAQRSAAALISNSLPVGSDYYAFRARSAVGTAEYLERQGASPKVSGGANFIKASERFRVLAEVYDLRADLYSAPSLPSRLLTFLRLSAKGGYIGPGIIALGWKSGAKDFAYSLGLFGILRRVRG